MKRGWVVTVLAGAVVVLLLLVSRLGLYTVQPIGAIPDGVTLAVWRGAYNEPFFNSPDATCLRVQGTVSLICRAVALGAAPTERIILRLPYSDWAYLMSTDGYRFDR